MRRKYGARGQRCEAVAGAGGGKRQAETAIGRRDA
jgi:hypothetical protein